LDAMPLNPFRATDRTDSSVPSLARLVRKVRRRAILPALAVSLVALIGISSVIGFMLITRDQTRLSNYRYVTRDLRIFQEALLEADSGSRGFVVSQKAEYLQPYVSGVTRLETLSADLLPKLEQYVASLPNTHGEATPVQRRVKDLRQAWATAMEQAETGRLSEAQASLQTMQAKSLVDEVRAIIAGYIIQRTAEAEEDDRRVGREQDALLVINPTGAMIAIIAMIYAFRIGEREARGREQANAHSLRARRQVEELFGMADTLQSANGAEDANEVLRATALRLLPDLSGVLYVFNNSRDRLDLSTCWGTIGADAYPDHIAPSSCWALKRGKSHINAATAGALRCGHAGDGRVSLEIPMMARGQIYGLLEVCSPDEEAEHRLRDIQPLAAALADAMSLALSSIALREQLRNQALRDPLTGLYNRRFLEEMLERLGLDAERRRTPMSAIMIDLDHFKRLNDQHGHAAGDAVLRDVGATVLSTLRATDVACRYGGEELAILLPDCSLDMAIGRAEQMRARIVEIAQTRGGVGVTASFGVASIPETATRALELLPTADAALYQAKHQGRDRVVAAALRPATAPAGRLDLVRATPVDLAEQPRSA
jgi:diguanylate cyclase (GGDEF)-like protein